MTLPQIPTPPRPAETVLELKDVWFQYQKGADPILRNLNLAVRRGELFCLLGGNGTGKTTALSILSGQKKPGDGKALIEGNDVYKKKNTGLFSGVLGVLPQNPQSMFVFETLREDLMEILARQKLDKTKAERELLQMSERMGLSDLLERHPYDLSGGELQRAALAKILLTKPRILLLDEPTKGLDALAKEEIGELLTGLSRNGTTILMATHDVEFAAAFATQCALFFDGGIVTQGTARELFSGNSFYTTAVSRIARAVCADAITCEEEVRLCTQSIPA